MDVSLRDRRAPPRDNIETRARYAWHDLEADWRVASPRPGGPRRRSHAGDADRDFEKVERFFYYGAAALVIVGTVIVVGSAMWGAPPQNLDPADSLTPQKIAPAGAAASRTPPANLRAHEQPVSIVAGPVASPPQEGAAAARDSEPSSAVQPSNAVAASSAKLGAEPDSLNEGLAGARRDAADGAPDAASSVAESEAVAPEAPTRKCYVKISGRVLEGAACQISQNNGAVTFQYSGQTLTLSPVKGKTWSATLAGKSLGNVYKSGSCWTSKSAHICDRGAR